ncbi:MAG TPA: hypothetical protein VFU78_00700 [Thermomicrobiales bacterium]|nr:hypothetical protein [Thermomicrobiales bacterium]
MDVTDFARSFVTFFGNNQGNIARIQVDAACTITESGTGETTTYYLIAPCRAERMYLATSLLQLPNYEFCGIFTTTECLIIRTHWRSDRDNREYGRNNVRFADVRIDVHTARARELAMAGEVVAATLGNAPLVARTALESPHGQLSALLEYPVKTMNVLPPETRFQVDTGPILLPDFASPATRPIERFDLAYAVYHEFDKAEFILRRPVSLAGDGDNSAGAVTDYSVVMEVAARHNLFALLG